MENCIICEESTIEYCVTCKTVFCIQCLIVCENCGFNICVNCRYICAHCEKEFCDVCVTWCERCAASPLCLECKHNGHF